jgi:hypothetical protein
MDWSSFWIGVGAALALNIVLNCIFWMLFFGKVESQDKGGRE